jgi:cell division protease FtsH
MITDYGMSDKFRNVYLPTRRAGGAYLDDGGLLQRDYAESTQTYVDEETARVIDERYEAVLALLEEHRDLLVEIAEELLRVEVIDRERFEQIVG